MRYLLVMTIFFVVMNASASFNDWFSVSNKTSVLTVENSQGNAILGNDGDLVDAYNIDQSAYRDWGTYRALHQQNVARIFKQMEFN